ncbi:hypothetical protein, partial [Pseudomonas sp. SLFW]|uniref:hypothetical protein n=1 Tax=Pseudomonas sp. SLFW TaxID=2683259 RepID=UPI001C498F0B
MLQTAWNEAFVRAVDKTTDYVEETGLTDLTAASRQIVGKPTPTPTADADWRWFAIWILAAGRRSAGVALHLACDPLRSDGKTCVRHVS